MKGYSAGVEAGRQDGIQQTIEAAYPHGLWIDFETALQTEDSMAELSLWME